MPCGPKKVWPHTDVMIPVWVFVLGAILLTEPVAVWGSAVNAALKVTCFVAELELSGFPEHGPFVFADAAYVHACARARVGRAGARAVNIFNFEEHKLKNINHASHKHQA